jgi:hypothetical protein
MEQRHAPLLSLSHHLPSIVAVQGCVDEVIGARKINEKKKKK